jgi:hypothetical protein
MYWSAGFGTFLQVSALASYWLGDCANFTPTQIVNRKSQKIYLVHKPQIRKMPNLRKVRKSIKKLSPQICGFAICGTYLQTTLL